MLIDIVHFGPAGPYIAGANNSVMTAVMTAVMTVLGDNHENDVRRGGMIPNSIANATEGKEKEKEGVIEVEEEKVQKKY